jgi:predicted CxxxxCH...CXXCH cytochrome family protein
MLGSNHLIRCTLAGLLALCLCACAQRNDQTAAIDPQGQHVANWIVLHRQAYQSNPAQCAQCHGADLASPGSAGGIAKVDCFNQAGLATCHAGGHGPRIANHPLPFKDPLLHGPVARLDLTNCQKCHSTLPNGGAGSNPRFNVLIGSLTTGCEGAGCHLPFMAHAKPWLNHPGSGNEAQACALCHGVLLSGGNGPACTSCHASLPPGQLPVPGQCASCHANPPSGTSAPNRAGSHAAHVALPELRANCGACHLGGGTGTTVHYALFNNLAVFKNATVAVLPAFNAKSGTARYNRARQTCSNVKCHGGQESPVWGTPLVVERDCTSCHSIGQTQFNSFFSGQHDFHVNQENIACIACHEVIAQTAAPNHFSNLSSASFNQRPSSTVRSVINYLPAGLPSPSCSPPDSLTVSTQTQGNQVFGCHAPPFPRLQVW